MIFKIAKFQNKAHKPAKKTSFYLNSFGCDRIFSADDINLQIRYENILIKNQYRLNAFTLPSALTSLTDNLVRFLMCEKCFLT